MSYNSYPHTDASQQGASYSYGYSSYSYGDESQGYYSESTAAASAGSFDDGREGDSHAHKYNDGGATAGSQDPYYVSQRVEDYLQQGQEVQKRRDGYATDPRGTKRSHKEKIANEIGNTDSGRSKSKSSHSKDSHSKDSHSKDSYSKSKSASGRKR